MRKTLTTAALLLALSCPAFAGEIHTTGAPTPPPQPSSAVQEPTDDATVDGVIHTPGVTDALTQTVLAVIVSVLP